jgi:molybdate transport system substrate-binding protein
MPKSNWANDWTVAVPVLIDRHGQTVLAEGRAELLAAIGTHRSITKAAKAIGISYRKAWSLIQEINAAAGTPLVSAAVGGAQGGGADLTERGRFALRVYDQVRRTLHQTAAGALQRAVSPETDATQCIHLAAAISLQEVIAELLAEYALRKPTVRVRAVFGASDELADHVVAGAACDIFISAEQREIDRLNDAKMLVPGSQQAFASNSLALIGTPESKPINRIADMLAGSIKHVALAEPACPLGRYSKAYLQSAGIYDDLLPKVLHVDNSRAVPSAVISRAAEIGLAFGSDAERSEKCKILFRVPSSQATTKYVAALIRDGRQQKEAKALFEFLTSPEAATSLRRCGFRPA